MPLISKSMPRDRHVDSMILKHESTVGSWLHSSSSSEYDSSREKRSPMWPTRRIEAPFFCCFRDGA